MRKRVTIFLILVIIMMIAGSACVNQEKASQSAVNNENSTKPAVTDEAKEVSVAAEVVPEYYFNIQIVSPSVLEELNIRKDKDAHLITDENNDLIGVVTPKTLYLRGDLYDIRGKTDSDLTLSKDEISNHLIDIAFGLDNSKINKWQTDKDYKFWFDANYDQDDIDYVLKFAKLFNSISETTQIEDEEVERGFLQSNYVDIPYNYYNIRIMPEVMLEEFKDNRDSSDKLIKDDKGNLVGMVNLNYLYLRNDLSTQDREKYLEKGILWSLGCHGTTYDLKDSYFYPKYTGDGLSEIDIEAIRLLYGGKLKPGMDLDETKTILGLKS